jgi:hypothetical protein
MTHFMTSNEERLAEMRKLIPLGREGSKDDIGALALYLGSRGSNRARPRGTARSA